MKKIFKMVVDLAAHNRSRGYSEVKGENWMRDQLKLMNKMNQELIAAKAIKA